MSQTMQCTSDNDQGKRMRNEMLSMNKGESLYWRALPTLAKRLRGELVLPGDPDFDSLRAGWNAAFNVRKLSPSTAQGWQVYSWGKIDKDFFGRLIVEALYIR